MRSLHAYSQWVIQQGWERATARPVVLERRTLPLLTVSVLHRIDNYQVELVELSPSRVPRHRHPAIDSCEYFLSGSSFVDIAHRTFYMHPQMPQAKLLLPIPSFAWHGAVVGGDGITFLSIQRWTEGIIPSSAVENWEGPEERVRPYV